MVDIVAGRESKNSQTGAVQTFSMPRENHFDTPSSYTIIDGKKVHAHHKSYALQIVKPNGYREYYENPIRTHVHPEPEVAKPKQCRVHYRNHTASHTHHKPHPSKVVWPKGCKNAHKSLTSVDGTKDELVKPVVINKDLSRSLSTKSKKTRALKGPKSRVSEGIPRGLQVRAYKTDDLKQGFPYPKVLAKYDISKRDWRSLLHALIFPLNRWFGHGAGVGYEIENILDVVAEWDQQLCRQQKGLLMRLDMPGEEKYGLDFMDLYYEGTGNRKTFNIGHGIEGSGHKNKMKGSKSRDLARTREKMFESTRLVFDPMIVSEDKTLYEQRGWARWDKQCAEAKKSLMSKLSQPEVRVDNEPWDFGQLQGAQRCDRWPPSKHFYYDRWRGKQIHIEVHHLAYSFMIPDYDSMDQRGDPEHNSVIPCDEVPRMMLRRGPKDSQMAAPGIGTGGRPATLLGAVTGGPSHH